MVAHSGWRWGARNPFLQWKGDVDLPQYDELHVISDLHMGGECADFQILRETKRLAGFIYWVAEQRPGGRVALVLNGDVVDTLAEEIGGYIAVNNAVAAVERIIKDNSFAQVWDARTRWQKPNRTLDVVIGNHDIERAPAGSASHPLAARRR